MSWQHQLDKKFAVMDRELKLDIAILAPANDTHEPLLQINRRFGFSSWLFDCGPLNLLVISETPYSKCDKHANCGRLRHVDISD